MMLEEEAATGSPAQPQNGAQPQQGAWELQGASDDRKRAFDDQGESIAIKIVFGKQAVTTSRPLLSTVAELKADIASQTGDGSQNKA